MLFRSPHLLGTLQERHRIAPLRLRLPPVVSVVLVAQLLSLKSPRKMSDSRSERHGFN